VQDFCDLMATRDAEVLCPFLADDAVYQNTGMPATRPSRHAPQRRSLSAQLFLGARAAIGLVPMGRTESYGAQATWHPIVVSLRWRDLDTQGHVYNGTGTGPA